MPTQTSIKQSTNLASLSSKKDLQLIELILILLIAGSGFLVDVYDIVIFSVVRVPSLTSLGVSKEQMLPTGVFLLNMQLLGMILGGFIWGILGDKKGRKASLFGSIFLYSSATFLNGFASSIPFYAVCRLLTGIGLAGEVGAAMVIAAEVTPAKYRTYGTATIRGLGALGGLLACLVGDRLTWEMTYITAGLAGFLLLLGRMSLKETNLFVHVLENKHIQRGSIQLLLTNKDRLIRISRCVLAAVPLWFVFGVLISFAPEIFAEIYNAYKGIPLEVTVAAAAFTFSIGMMFGEIINGLFSQFLRSRKLSMIIFVFGALISTFLIKFIPAQFYIIACLSLGFFISYASIVYTTTAEQFGTNLRSTATTLVPNFVRASAVPVTALFSILATKFGALNSALITGALCYIGALISIWFMEETFARDLNFIEN